MDYAERIQRTIEHIERRLNEPITLEELAKVACFSAYHYHRMFQALTGDTVMEYVRKRRLSEAALALTRTDKRVIDIALDVGFHTHETFTRAFKKCFDMTPETYRKRTTAPIVYPKLELRRKLVQAQGGSSTMEDLNPKIIVKPAFHVVGYAVRTRNADGENQRDIPAFWQRYLQEGLGNTIPNPVNPMIEYGICADIQEDGSFVYLIGLEAAPLDVLPEGMCQMTVPEAKYAVFTTPKATDEAFTDSIQRTWGRIYGEWFPASGYEQDMAPEFELYDERCHGSTDKVMDIYIPIK